MFSYSNPAITFSRDTESAYHLSKRSEPQDKFLNHSTSQYPRRRSRDAIIGEENGDFATLMRIRQAVSAATIDHTQRKSTVQNPSGNRSRPSPQYRSHDRSSSTESQALDFPEISMLGNDLRESRISASHSRQRSRSTDSSDSVSSNLRSLSSATFTLPRSETSASQQAENSSAVYNRSTDRYNSRRSRPYASYYTKENSTYSDYEISSQVGCWDSPPPVETTRSYHSASGTPEPSIYEDILQSNSGNHTFYTDDTESGRLSRKTNHLSRPEDSHKQTPKANMDDTVYISRTPSLTSTQNSPPSTPSSYSDSSFIIADYSIDQEQPSTSSNLHHPSPHIEQDHPANSLHATDESSITRHFSKPRRFFRTKTKPRSRVNSDADESTLFLSTSTETTSNHHKLISPPISPLTPSITLPILHFPTTVDSHSNNTSKAPVSVLSARSCSLYANVGFSAGLSFGIPAPELGIRLASLETMAERQGILLGRRGGLAR